MQLPASWVEALFAKLTVRYGAAFMRQYADLDVALVKADWSEVLGGFHARPDALRYGLDSLTPERPPNALQFRALCNSGPRDDGFLKLPQPGPAQAGPELHAIHSRLSEARASIAANDPMAWAWKLRQREAQGPGLTRAQREMWRTALPGVALHDEEVAA